MTSTIPSQTTPTTPAIASYRLTGSSCRKLALALTALALLACAIASDDDVDTIETSLGGCISFGNPTGGPGQICGSFADTFRYFATGGNPGAYSDGAHFNTGLALFGYPVTGQEARSGDTWMTFERVEMNAGGGCPYGACVSLSGTIDVKATGFAFQEGITQDCWEPGFKARPLHCLDDFRRPNLSLVTTRIGGNDIRLEYYGLPISAPMNCDWWDQKIDHSRECVYTQRAKLGYFPGNPDQYQWQGEQLGLKAKRRRDGATFDVLPYMRSTHGGTLKASGGSIVAYYAPPNSNKFYYIKGSANNNNGTAFERYGFDGHDIWLERDTTWNVSHDGGGVYSAYDAVNPTTNRHGSLIWGKRVESHDDTIDFQTQIIGFSPGTCKWSNSLRNSLNTGNMHIRHQRISIGGSVGDVDAIAVDYTQCETFWYAKDWGWVKWEYHDVCPNRPGPDITWNQWSSTSHTPSEPCAPAPLPFGGT